MRVSGPASSALAALLLIAAACGDDTEPKPEATAAAEKPAIADEPTGNEAPNFLVDPSEYGEMQDGRLDTIDMIERDGDAAFHLQTINYTPDYTAITYAAWYEPSDSVGSDSVVRFATDGQLRLVDSRGTEYEGVEVIDNPRMTVAAGTTAVGVYLFLPGIQARPDSLVIYVNEATSPVLEIGPFGLFHDHTANPTVETLIESN